MEQEDQAQELEGTAAFDYQLDRHCSKTSNKKPPPQSEFDYQLDRHCSKTTEREELQAKSLITS